jgi:S1-C subfamily serine protease
MKQFITLIALCLPFLWAGKIFAQQEGPSFVIVQKEVNEQGEVSVSKKRITPEDDLKEVMNQFQEGTFEVQILTGDGDLEEADHEQIFFIRKAGETGPTVKKPFLGVYPTSHSEGAGVYIKQVVNNSGAKAAGLLAGDVLLQIEDIPLQQLSDLDQALRQFESGQTVSVNFLRNGQRQSTQVTLTARNSIGDLERDPCQVFIGVYTMQLYGSSGLRVSGVIEDTPADQVGLQKGDIIMAMDDVYVRTHDELLKERNKHQPGDEFTLLVERNGAQMEVDAQFGQCSEEEPEQGIIEDPIPNIDDELDATFDNTLEVTNYQGFPNPTYGQFNLVFQAQPVATQIRVTDITGKVIYQEQLNQFDGYYNQRLDLSQATPGILILTIQQGGKVLSDQIVLLARA